MGETAPTSGTVSYLGKDLTKLSRAERNAFRRDVQVIFQDPYEVYNPFYPVDHVLTMPARKFHLAQTKAETDEAIHQALQASRATSRRDASAAIRINSAAGNGNG
ncbi:MAG: hypothetical protein R2848_00195 [Thermomicrobiales bacterium]